MMWASDGDSPSPPLCSHGFFSTAESSSSSVHGSASSSRACVRRSQMKPCVEANES